MQGLANVMVKEDMMTGWKSRIFGYISRGERVPEVMTTVWNRLKTGLIAIDESKQLQIPKINHKYIQYKQLFK